MGSGQRGRSMVEGLSDIQMGSVDLVFISYSSHKIDKIVWVFS